MTRPWIAVVEGQGREFPTAKAALNWWLDTGKVTARVISPRDPLYADLDALPVLTVEWWCGQVGHLDVRRDGSCRRCLARVGVARA